MPYVLIPQKMTHMNQPLQTPRSTRLRGDRPSSGKSLIDLSQLLGFGWNVGRICFQILRIELCFIKIKHRSKHFLLNQRIRWSAYGKCAFVCFKKPSIPNRTGSLMASFIWMFPYSSCHGTEAGRRRVRHELSNQKKSLEANQYVG